MKKLLIKLLNLQPLIDAAYRQGKSDEQDYQTERSRNKEKINYPIGSKVILIYNSPGNLDVAEIVEYQSFPSGQIFPIYKFENGRVGTSFGKSIHFDQNRFNTLSKLSWWERWNAATDFAASFSEQTAFNTASGRPSYLNEDGSEIEDEQTA